MQRLRTIAAAGMVAATAVGLIGCSTGPTDTDEPTSITIATQYLLTTWGLDTSLWFLSQHLVYEPLITWDDETAGFAPWLAKEYEISDDGLSTVFTLRDDVVFSDGTQMDADGVAKMLNAAFEEGSGFAYLAGAWGPNATATGEYTVEFTTTRPVTNESVMMLAFSTIAILSPAAIDDPTLVESEPIGTGPYLVEDVTPEVSATYVRNPDYWNPDAFEFDEITLVAMADKVAALNALKSGQIDAAEIDSSLAAAAEESGLDISAAPSGFTAIFIVDREGANNPPLGDARVRQALSYAIDRVAIVEAIERGYGITSSQPFDANSSEYVEGGDDRYAYDPDRARELLAEAGYPDGFTIKLNRAAITATDYTAVIEQYFRDIGVTIEWVEGADVIALASNLEVDGVIHSLPFAFTITSYADGTWWATQPVQDPEYLELMERYNGSPEEHDGAVDEVADYFHEQAWHIVISQPEAIWASSPDVQVDVAGGLRGALLPRISWFSLPE